MKPFAHEAGFPGIVTLDNMACRYLTWRVSGTRPLPAKVSSRRKDVKNLCSSPRSGSIKKNGG